MKWLCCILVLARVLLLLSQGLFCDFVLNPLVFIFLRYSWYVQVVLANLHIFTGFRSFFLIAFIRFSIFALITLMIWRLWSTLFKIKDMVDLIGLYIKSMSQTGILIIYQFRWILMFDILLAIQNHWRNLSWISSKDLVQSSMIHRNLLLGLQKVLIAISHIKLIHIFTLF